MKFSSAIPLALMVSASTVYGQISFEATSGVITAPFVIIGNTVSQPSATLVPADGGRAAYTFSVAAGSYTVSVKVNAPSESTNSLFVNIDAEPTTNMTWHIPLTSGLQSRTVSWDTVPQVFALTAGTHQLIVRGREATQFGTITISPTTPVPPPASGPGTVTLGWDASPDTSVTGYKVYQGGLSGVFTNSYSVSGRSTTTYQVSNLKGGITYFFTCSATDGAGLESAYSNEISYQVPQAPIIVTQPASGTNNVGTTRIFTVAATGGNLIFQWMKNGVNLVNQGNISGVSASTLTIASVTGIDNGKYSVKVTSAGGTVTSAQATLSVIPAAPVSVTVKGS